MLPKNIRIHKITFDKNLSDSFFSSLFVTDLKLKYAKSKQKDFAIFEYLLLLKCLNVCASGKRSGRKCETSGEKHCVAVCFPLPDGLFSLPPQGLILAFFSPSRFFIEHTFKLNCFLLHELYKL